MSLRPSTVHIRTCRSLFWRLHLFLVFGSLATCLAQPPNYLLDKWTAADGLPSSEVNGLARTPDGFLWVGTAAGLARFDGAQFQVMSHNNLPGFDSHSIREIVVGKDARLYMAAPTGLVIVKDQVATTIATARGTNSDPVQVILPMAMDEAWFGTARGHLYHYHHGIHEEVGAASLSGAAVYGLAAAPDGTLWIGTENGLFTLDKGHISRYHPAIDLPVSGVFDLAVTENGAVYAATDRGVLSIQGKGWQIWGAHDGLPSDRVQVLAASGDVLWIGTSAGVARLAEKRIQPVTTPPCSVTAFHIESANSVWVGCEHAGGVLHLRQPAVRLLATSVRVPVPRTVSLAEDEAGVVWMATAHGLLRWQANRSKLYSLPSGLPTDNLYAVSVAPDGSVWMGTENGFAQMREGKITAYRTQEQGPQDPVYSILQDRSGDLWIGAERGLLVRRKAQLTLEENPKIQGRILSIRQDHIGSIWVATREHGLFRIMGNSQTQFTTACGLASNNVRDILEDENGDIWAATSSGLTRIRKDRCTSVRYVNGYPLDDTIGFASDRRGHLWIRRLEGILALDLEQANHVLDYGGTLTRARFYGDDDGLREQLVNVSTCNSVVRLSSGEMWFATLSGVGRVDPSIFDVEPPPLKTQVTSLVSDDGDHSLGKPILIKSDDPRIQVTYTAAALLGAGSLQFRYRLLRFDKNWRPGEKQREATYTSLGPGKYIFVVSARRPFGPWSDDSGPLDIHVLPHFYETWWWYAMVTVALISMGAITYQLRLIAIRRQFATLMSERLRERSRLARELHDTLAQGMVGIHLQIEAAQVLLDVDPASVRKHLESVGQLARQASIETRKSIAELRSSEVEDPTLIGALEKVASEFQHSSSIVLSTQIDESLPELSPEVIHEISRITEEALANVRLHSGANHASLSAVYSRGYLNIEVRDDGKGFIVEAPKAKPGHFGLTGMDERAHRIRGRLHITSRPGRGASVTLTAPLRTRWRGSRAYAWVSIFSTLQRRMRVWRRT